MRRIIIISFLIFFFIPVQTVSASLVTVDPDGNIVVSVLAESDSVGLIIPKSEEMTVKDSLAPGSDSNSLLTLRKELNGVVLSVFGVNGEKTLEVTDYKDEVIRIEERPETVKLSILVNGSKFEIKQGGLVATTEYEITVDPKKARILLEAPSGQRFLSITPKEATQTLLRAKTLSTFDLKSGVTIVEDDDHSLTYRIEGVKSLDFFDFYEYPVEVTAYVSALTGEILTVDQPQWLDILGFLFV